MSQREVWCAVYWMAGCESAAGYWFLGLKSAVGGARRGSIEWYVSDLLIAAVVTVF